MPMIKDNMISHGKNNLIQCEQKWTRTVISTLSSFSDFGLPELKAKVLSV